MRMIDKIKSMDRNTIITGQLFFRYQGDAIELDYSNRKVFSVVGSIALPKDCPIKNAYQYALAGYEYEQEKGLFIIVDPSSGVDLKKESKGMNIGSLLTRPIWKI